MKKTFGELHVGEKGYPIQEGGRINIQSMIIKVDSLKLTKGTGSLLMTDRVRNHEFINAVIIEDPGKQKGYFDFLGDEDLIEMENPIC